MKLQDKFICIVNAEVLQDGNTKTNRQVQFRGKNESVFHFLMSEPEGRRFKVGKSYTFSINPRVEPKLVVAVDSTF